MGTRILPAAKARILAIWNYTEAAWGEEQADKYVRDLIEAIQRSGQNRGGWRAVQDPALRGIFFIKQAHHFIFSRNSPVATLV